VPIEANYQPAPGIDLFGWTVRSGEPRLSILTTWAAENRLWGQRWRREHCGVAIKGKVTVNQAYLRPKTNWRHNCSEILADGINADRRLIVHRDLVACARSLPLQRLHSS
jgi:hypothetical protein